MARLLVEEGAKDVTLGTPVAIIVSKKEHVAAFANYTPPAAGAAPAKKAAATPEPAKASAPTPSKSAEPAHAEGDSFKGRVFASPRARREALDRGIDIAHVKGSGPGGRIVFEDVVSFKSTPAPA